MHIVAGSFSSSTGALRALCEKHRPDIIIVDASYLLTPEKRNASRRENLVDVANDLKKISIDFVGPLFIPCSSTGPRFAGKKNEEEETQQAPPPTQTQARNPNSPVVEDQRYDAPEAPAARLSVSVIDYENVVALGLHKIAETDAIAANASIVAAIARPKGTHYEDRRYYTILKGREGERGLWMINYRFSRP